MEVLEIVFVPNPEHLLILQLELASVWIRRSSTLAPPAVFVPYHWWRIPSLEIVFVLMQMPHMIQMQAVAYVQDLRSMTQEPTLACVPTT
jgi:hypothetical protein